MENFALQLFIQLLLFVKNQENGSPHYKESYLKEL